MLTFLDFQRKNEKRCIEGFNHSLDGWSLLEWCGAACGEFGEAANKAKKIKRIEMELKGNKKNENYDNLKLAVAQEICDGIIYGFLTLSAAGFDAEQMIREAFNNKSKEIGSDVEI